MDFLQNIDQSSEKWETQEKHYQSLKECQWFPKIFYSIRSKPSLLMIHDHQSRTSLIPNWFYPKSRGIFPRYSRRSKQSYDTINETLRALICQKVDDFLRRTISFKLKWKATKPMLISQMNNLLKQPLTQSKKQRHASWRSSESTWWLNPIQD